MKVTFIKPDALDVKLFQNNREAYDEFLNQIETCNAKVGMFGFYEDEALLAIILITIQESVDIKALYLTNQNQKTMYDVIQYLKMQYVKKDIQTCLNLPELTENEFEYNDVSQVYIYIRNKHPEDQFKDLSGKLRAYPSKLTDKQIVLNYIASSIKPSHQYKESELNSLIQSFINFEDFVTIRRDLFDFKYIDRDPLTSRYWKVQV